MEQSEPGRGLGFRVPREPYTPRTRTIPLNHNIKALTSEGIQGYWVLWAGLLGFWGPCVGFGRLLGFSGLGSFLEGFGVLGGSGFRSFCFDF